jgi:hypothetical protein
MTHVVWLTLASILLAAQAPPIVLRFDRWVENDLPSVPFPQLKGMKVHFAGTARPPVGKVLGPVTSGEVSEEKALSIGFVQAPQLRMSRIGSCPQVWQAAVVQLANEARGKGADAVVDVRSVTHEPIRPSYLCIIKRNRGEARDQREYMFVSLTGTMLQLD